MSDKEANVVDLSSVTEEDLEKVRARNTQKLLAIRQQGANLDVSGVAARRLDILIDLILTKQQRVQFEFAFETTMTEVLDEALAELRKASLVQGLNGKAQKLILPNGN